MGMTTITTCAQALAAWDDGGLITSINISGFPLGYERGCQNLMFESIRQYIEHEGDAEFWDGQEGKNSSDFFTDANRLACDEGMTGAMWGASVAAAVVMLRNTWAGGIDLAPDDRLIEISRTQRPSTNPETIMR